MTEDGHGFEDDVPTLHDIYKQMAGNCFCLLGESAVMPIKSALELFPEEFDQIIQHTAKNGQQRNGKHAMSLEPA
jgi:NADH-quinone oxidoreductase subunit F